MLREVKEENVSSKLEYREKVRELRGSIAVLKNKLEREMHDKNWLEKKKVHVFIPVPRHASSDKNAMKQESRWNTKR